MHVQTLFPPNGQERTGFRLRNGPTNVAGAARFSGQVTFACSGLWADRNLALTPVPRLAAGTTIRSRDSDSAPTVSQQGQQSGPSGANLNRRLQLYHRGRFRKGKNTVFLHFRGVMAPKDEGDCDFGNMSNRRSLHLMLKSGNGTYIVVPFSPRLTSMILGERHAW